jgi:PIN domain nuclease of toxin-antitoxin system
LLDTHALLWSLSTPRKLPRPLAAAIRDPANAVYMSAASTWELAIKAALGKVDVHLGDLAKTAEQTGFTELPVFVRHTIELRGLPPHHRDPFDRILIAQAMVEGLTVVTRDRAFGLYDVQTLWGRR